MNLKIFEKNKNRLEMSQKIISLVWGWILLLGFWSKLNWKKSFKIFSESKPPPHWVPSLYITKELLGVLCRSHFWEWFLHNRVLNTQLIIKESPSHIDSDIQLDVVCWTRSTLTLLIFGSFKKEKKGHLQYTLV